MSDPHAARPSPVGKRVSLFVTCIVDQLYPDTGMNVVEVLEHLGITVDFPMAQTCCGQPGYNAGYHDEAKAVAQQFLRAFAASEVIVTPSGSCAAMVRHEYPRLFADDPLWRPHVDRAAARTWEFTEYLVDGLGITDVGAALPQPTALAIHHACHGMRVLGLRRQAQALLDATPNAHAAELPNCEACCGFGGLFAVKMPEVSGAMLGRKLDDIAAAAADAVVTGDASCLTQINGGLSRAGAAVRVRHIADVLADGLRARPNTPSLPENTPEDSL